MAQIPRSAGSSEAPVERQRQRSKKVWNNRAAWDSLYQEAYDYVLPNRMPGGLGKAKRPAQLIFDMTGPNAAMHCAGEIQRQVFPASTPFMIEAGPLLAAKMPLDQKKVLNRALSSIANQIYPYFQTGDFDTAIHEMCTDLTIGTGAVLPVRGPSIEQPIGFVCIPQGELAIAQDAWGRVNYASWKRENLGREAIVEAWPKGKFSREFREAAQNDPYGEVTVYQDFFRLPDGRWRFVAYLDKGGGDFIVSETYRTQPIAVARFYRWPGEAYGRGPVLFALPSIKTANKAQELALKAAAIQMLGIWGFRAGGTFNPDTVRVGPGEFWPMQSTGGVLGPDVQRLDPSAGRLDVTRMVTEGLQSQIREALLDTRIHDKQGTPRAASEIAAVVQQNASVHIGAYGRLNRETIQVIVPRGMEILNEWGLLPNLMAFNQLLVAMQVNSPMAAALKADELRAMTNYYELAAAVAGPENVGRYIHMDRFLDRSREIMLISNDIVPTPAEQEQAAQAAAAQQTATVAANMATRAAPQLAQGMIAEETA